MGKQSLTLKCLARIFSLKCFLEKLLVLLTISWVMRVCIVLVKVCEKAHLKTSGREFCGSLARWPESQMTCEIQPSKDSSNSSICFSRGLFAGWYSWDSHELVVNSSSSQNLHQTFTHNFYIKSYKNTGKWLNRNTIKFDTELKIT